MKTLIICLCFISVMSCKTDNSQTKNAIASIDLQVPKLESVMNPIETPFNTKEPYKLKLNLKKYENNAYDLDISMELYNDAHFVSPNAKRDFKGKFTVFIEDNDNIERTSKLLETPLSVEEYDSHPFTNGLVNWVRVNTTYKQKIKRTTGETFEVMGYIQFTIEPRCTLEKIPFIIKYKNDEMKFEVFQC